MDSLFIFIATCLGFAVFILAVGYLREANRIFLYLAEHEPAIWQALGSPVIPRGSGDPQIEDAVRNSFSRRIRRFLMQREYAAIENRSCVSHCAALRKRLVALAACACGFALSAAAAILAAIFGP